jgi:hypothetical protein
MSDLAIGIGETGHANYTSVNQLLARVKNDNAGRDVPAGVYWVRVSDAVSTRAHKVVLIRR